ncbi:MAG: IS21-like element helper ATPase IstB [Lachnoclostridium sp.]|jgi:DNA replication protein DnaC
MNIYNNVLNNLDELKLEKIKSCLADYLDSIKSKDLTPLEILKDLTDMELEAKKIRSAKSRIGIANFPYERTIQDFDFDYQPSINKREIQDLATLRFIEQKQNILFIGSPGVGKTHLATAIGMEAAQKRYITYFISCHDLIAQLCLAYRENRLESRLRHYSKYKLLIIDEIGYLPIDKLGANLFFQLIARRYEKNSTIITTNQPFSKWAEVFDDSVIAAAILDRLLHHSIIINITGKSYRTKDKLIAPSKQQAQN